MCIKGIVEKVKARLSGFVASSLSLAGRTMLVDSVSMAIPVYTMQSTRIPRGTLEEVERVC